MLENEPRHAIGFRTLDTGQTNSLEICHCRSETILLTPNASCEACSAFTRVAACTLAPSPYFVTRYPKASDISSPPCLLRLLPAGAVAGWDLHPLESAAFSRRTPKAAIGLTILDDRS